MPTHLSIPHNPMGACACMRVRAVALGGCHAGGGSAHEKREWIDSALVLERRSATSSVSCSGRDTPAACIGSVRVLRLLGTRGTAGY